MNSDASAFIPIEPKILYFGTPVAVISSLNPDGSTNLAALSSFWALEDRFVLGLTTFGQTGDNLARTPECVLNFPSAREWPHVERLGHTTGRAALTAYHREAQITYVADKFAVSGFTSLGAERVTPLRVAECPLQVEARVVAIHAAQQEGHFRLFEVRKERVHAHRDLMQSDRQHIDLSAWSPLLYVFRHYFGTGPELGRSFRATY